MRVSDQIKQIEQYGFCRIPSVFEPEEMVRAKEVVERWFEAGLQEQSDNVPFLNRNQAMVYNLQSKEWYFLELLFSKPILEDVLKHFLNDPWFKAFPPDEPNFILRSYTARSSNERLPMHLDSFVPYRGPHVYIMQCVIVLEEFTQENGCTLVVPGSHLSGEWATQEAMDDAVPLEGKPGDVILWDSRIWHGTRENRSGGTRWALLATFCRWWLKQAFNIPETLPQSIYERLTDRQKAVLGFCSIPYDDERFGIDMKRSYEMLPREAKNARRGSQTVVSSN